MTIEQRLQEMESQITYLVHREYRLSSAVRGISLVVTLTLAFTLIELIALSAR